MLTALLLAWGGFDISFGYADGSNLLTHFTYHFAHASVWHLAGNLLCFYLFIRNRSSFGELFCAYCIATICSFFSPHPLPTVGLSGLIYALLGMRIATLKRISRDFLIRLAVLLLLPAVSGKVNILLHLSCVAVGYTTILFYTNFKQIVRDVKRCDR